MPAPDGPKPVPIPPSTPLEGVVVYGLVVVGVVVVGVVVVGVVVEGVVVDGVVVTGVVVLVPAVLALEGYAQPVLLGSDVEMAAVPEKSQEP
jgi:hypothetical protein